MIREGRRPGARSPTCTAAVVELKHRLFFEFLWVFSPPFTQAVPPLSAGEKLEEEQAAHSTPSPSREKVCARTRAFTPCAGSAIHSEAWRRADTTCRACCPPAQLFPKPCKVEVFKQRASSFTWI